MADEKDPTNGPMPSPYVLTPVPFPAYEPENQINMAVYLRMLWRRRHLILLGTLLCGLAAFAVSKMLPPTYQAKATLILQAPQFSTELKPAPLSVEMYQSILESDFMATKVKEILVAKKIVDPEVRIEEITGMLSVGVHSESGQIRQALLPLIDLVVEGDTPEKVEAVANTYAHAFVKESVGLSSRGKQDTLDFIQAQYPAVSKLLANQETELKVKQNYYGRNLVDLEKRWAQRILGFKKETETLKTAFAKETERLKTDFILETERLKTEHGQETERLKQEFLNRWKPDLLADEVKLKKEKLSKFQDDLLETELGIKTLKDTQEQLSRQIGKQPQFLVLSKAITDEALWAKLGKDKSGRLPEELQRLKLQSQHLNPIYQGLLDQLIATQVKYDTLIPRKEHLKKEIERVESEIDELKSKIAEEEIEWNKLVTGRALDLTTLLKTRELNLKRLVQDRALDLKVLTDKRASEEGIEEKRKKNAIAEFERERDTEVQKSTRETEDVKSVYEVLAPKYEMARLAESEEESDVKIGALAVVPERPIGPRVLFNTAAALAVGFMLSLMWAFVAEYTQSFPAIDSQSTGTGLPPTRGLGLESEQVPESRRELRGG
ncbi:MAG: GumC family protein [Acidobacteriota bacterium]